MADQIETAAGVDGERYCLRQAYVDTLLTMAQERTDFVVLDADSREATKVDRFAARYPDRCFSFGIAEQNMVTAAAGFATTGITALANTYSMFIALRALDQVRNSVAYPNLDVKLVVSHCGLDVGQDGVTHQTTEDLAIMRAIPNMLVISPADDVEMHAATKFSLSYKGPVYLRTGRSPRPRVHSPDYQFVLGRPSTVREGSDVTIFAVGVMVEQALLAANELASDGVSALVANVSTLKPVDEEHLVALAARTGCVVTAEDHNRYAGLGGMVAELTAGYHPMPVEIVGVDDCYAEAGTPQQLFERYGLGVKDIVAAAHRANARRGNR